MSPLRGFDKSALRMVHPLYMSALGFTVVIGLIMPIVPVYFAYHHGFVVPAGFCQGVAVFNPGIGLDRSYRSPRVAVLLCMETEVERETVLVVVVSNEWRKVARDLVHPRMVRACCQICIAVVESASMLWNSELVWLSSNPYICH